MVTYSIEGQLARIHADDAKTWLAEVGTTIEVEADLGEDGACGEFVAYVWVRHQDDGDVFCVSPFRNGTTGDWRRELEEYGSIWPTAELALWAASRMVIEEAAKRAEERQVSLE